MLALFANIIEDEHEDMVLRRREQMIRRKEIRDNSDPFMMGDEVFKSRYRMHPWVSIDLIELLRPLLPEHPLGIPPHLQVLAVLRFMAEGSYQKGVAEDSYHPMSQPTFSKYLHIVIPAINYFQDHFISFPKCREEREVIQQGFEERLGFPGVIGVIDGTLPKIRTPRDHEEAYVDHHYNHSLNVQITCDVNYNILNIRICSGSTNDMFAWQHSDIRREMYRLRDDPVILAEEGRYYLIGDNGYTPSTVLLTPVLNAAAGTPEFIYSDTLRRTRCRIEQTIGIWKEIIRCLNSDRRLYYEMPFVPEIVNAGAVLYNFLRHHGMPVPQLPDDHVENQRPVFWHAEIAEEYPLGLQERNQIINAFFA